MDLNCPSTTFKYSVALLLLLLVSQQSTVLASDRLHQATRHTGRKQAQQDASLVQRGKAIFASNQCLDCHRVGGHGCIEGVELNGIGKARTEAFLIEQLKDPEAHVAKALKDFHGQTNLMASPNLNKAEIKAVVAYLRSLPPLKKTAGKN